MRYLTASILLFFSVASAAAQMRYEVIGDTLYFNILGEEPGYELTGQIESYDVRLLAEYLFEHPDIRALNITGPGGNMAAALDMAKDLADHDIDTIASGKCLSACTLVFLGGQKRSLADDARLGFHRQWVNGKNHQKIYKQYKDVVGWKDEFEYLMTTYDELVLELVDQLEFAINRGVSVSFVLKTLSIEVTDMWFPSRNELATVGYITDW